MTLQKSAQPVPIQQTKSTKEQEATLSCNIYIIVYKSFVMVDEYAVEPILE